jgi:hypothetical protein
MNDQERRRRANAALLEKFRNGESTAMVEAQATWWPPRPIIKKDPAAIARVLGEGEQGERPGPKKVRDGDDA